MINIFLNPFRDGLLVEKNAVMILKSRRDDLISLRIKILRRACGTEEGKTYHFSLKIKNQSNPTEKLSTFWE